MTVERATCTTLFPLTSLRIYGTSDFFNRISRPFHIAVVGKKNSGLVHFFLVKSSGFYK